MKITNVEDVCKIEQELLAALQVIDDDYIFDHNDTIDIHWLRIAKTDLEKGFMSLRRAMRNLEVVK